MEELEMLNKKERNLDRYKKVGAMMRLFKTLGSGIAVEASKVLPAKETDILAGILRKADILCCKAEERMLSDYPELGHEYTDVFYGSTKGETRNEADAEIIGIAKVAADELFK
jgi:hypothetical protein